MKKQRKTAQILAEEKPYCANVDEGEEVAITASKEGDQGVRSRRNKRAHKEKDTSAKRDLRTAG